MSAATRRFTATPPRSHPDVAPASLALRQVPKNLLIHTPDLHRTALYELYLVSVRVFYKGDVVVVAVRCDGFGLEGDGDALALEVFDGGFEVVDGEGDVGVAVALVVGLGLVVVVGELEHRLGRVLLQGEEVVGGGAEVHLADLLQAELVHVEVLAPRRVEDAVASVDKGSGHRVSSLRVVRFDREG